MTLASALVCAALAAQPALRPKTAEPLVPPPQKAPEGVPQAPAPAAAPPADEIPVAGADAGAVRVPSSPDALLPQQETAPVRASRQVCARPAVMIGWAAWVGPVESLQALAAAARTNSRIAEALSRMVLLR